VKVGFFFFRPWPLAAGARDVMKLRHTFRTAALTAAITLSLFGAPAARADTVTDAGAKAATWLAARQEADGGFGNGFAQGSDLGATADAIVALAAAGQRVAAVRSKSGRSPLDFLAQTLRMRRAIPTGQYAKMVLAVHAAGLDPSAFSRTDLIRPILSGYDAETGVIGDSVYVHCLGVLALARVGAEIPEKAIATLESFQTPSGGWAFMGDASADVDTTAVCAQALLAAGQRADAGPAAKALGYLRGLQNADGGFPYQVPSQFGTDTNANSTALVAQAIIASGEQPEAWAAAKGNPLSALIILQRPSGAIAYQAAVPDDNVLATTGAIPALHRMALGD
jgi:hypothetical protein